MTSNLPARSQAVAEALAAAGIPGEIRLLPDSARTAAEAAAALGCVTYRQLLNVTGGAPAPVVAE
ncbi:MULTISPECIES: hypothetical protein [unclassified Kitasatospora]